MNTRRETLLTAIGYYFIGLLINISTITTLSNTSLPIDPSSGIGVILAITIILTTFYFITNLDKTRSLTTPFTYLLPAFVIYPTAHYLGTTLTVPPMAALLSAVTLHVVATFAVHHYHSALNDANATLRELQLDES